MFMNFSVTAHVGALRGVEPGFCVTAVDTECVDVTRRKPRYGTWRPDWVHE